MQVHSNQDATAQRAQTDGAFRRLRERVADFLSPTLECSVCGGAFRQRHCDKTGVVRPIEGDRAWVRSAAYEIEHVCPSCGASIWVVQAATYVYPAG